MTKKYVFRKGLVIGIIILFVGASVVPSISGNVEEKNKTNIDIDPTLNEHIIKESLTNDNINNEKNERYRDTQPTIFNGGNSKGWSITEVISTESTNWSWRPSLMVDSGDVVHVTWMDYTDYGGSGQDWDIFYKYKNGDGSWSATEVVSTESTDHSWYPSLMVDSGGVVHVTWHDFTDYGGSGIDNDIFYKYKSGGNQPPNVPTIDGPASGKAGTSYDYDFTSTDLDGDDVKYFIDWGDGDTEWTEFVASGTPVTRSHTWTEKRTYEIKAKAKDTDDYESEWGTLTVTMPRNRAVNNPFLNFLGQHPNMFPVLRLLLQQLGL